MTDVPIDIDDILSDIKELSDRNTIKTKLLTSKDVINVNQLTSGQQRDILIKGMSDQAAIQKSRLVMNDILITNSSSPEKITTLDREYVMLQLRAKQFGKSITLYVEEDEYKVNLNTHIKSIIQPEEVALEFQIKHDSITIKCSVPDLKKDSKIIQETLTLVDFNEDDASVVSKLYTCELVKYIDSLQIDEKAVNFNDLSTEQCVRILESLPYAATNNLVKRISEFDDIVDQVVSSDQLPAGTTIRIDSTLFIDDE